MNRIIKTELISSRTNQRFRSLVYREIKRSSELSTIKPKELSANLANEELEPHDYHAIEPNFSQSPQQLPVQRSTPKYDLKYKIPKIELKEDKWEDTSNSNLVFESNLRSFLYSCINANQDKDVLKTLEHYQNKRTSLSRLGSASSLKLINIVAKNYALKDNLEGVESCLQFVEQLNFKPDLVFYSYFLYALAKQHQLDRVDSVVGRIERQQLNLAALFENSYLNSEQRALLIRTLHDCNYRPNFERPSGLEYNSRLLDSYQKTRRVASSPLAGLKFDEKLFYQQLNNEKDLFVRMKSAYSSAENELHNSLIDEITRDWNRSLRKAFDTNLKLMKVHNQDDPRMNIYPFLSSFDREKLTKFLVTYVIELAKSKFPASNSFLSAQIGYLLENQYLSTIKLKHTKGLKAFYKTYFDYISNEQKFAEANSRQFCRNMFLDLDLYNKELNEMVWSGRNRREVGNYVVQTCTETLRFNQNLLKPKSKGRAKILPALFRRTQFENGIRNDVIVPNDHLNKLISTIDGYSLLSAKDLPMLVPPFPWNSAEGFPFLISKLFLVIESSIIYERKIAEKIRRFNINAVLDSLNYTSLMPWKINADVLAIINQIFQNGGDYKLDIPHHHTKMPEVPRKEPDEDIKVYKKRVQETKKQNREMYALWCEMNYKLSIANYLKEKLFWFPNFIDFRGRVYPTSIYLSQVSNDVGRSLLMFGNGKKLGARGFDWLKIHLINLTGLKKRATNEERLEYANEILPSIIDSAERPLDGDGWWKQSDDPWQTLACCIEINKVLKSGADSAEFVSHFPVHQDGSCNGLQHYAALGRDFDGARSVNLLPAERPADVYSEVAALVEKKRVNDARNGDDAARVLEGHINRKLVKATVMTNVYGVTAYGAKLQFKKVLQDVDSFPKDHMKIASIYLARTVFNTIEDLFTCSKEIQDWLIAISVAIAKRINMPVEWLTPLGLPVVQYYFKSKGFKVKVDANRQKNGCPPNYIHSLDATHMMLTSLYCEKKGINFASVHDSYWTHPADVEEMSRTLREQFVNVYSDDLLQDLSNYLLNVYKPYLVENSLLVDKTDLEILNLIRNVPNRGKFDIRQVLESKYFFS